MCEAGLRGGPCGSMSILAELRHRGCLAEGCGKFCIVFVSVGSINIPYIVTAGLRVTRVARGLLLMHTSRRAGRRALGSRRWLFLVSCGCLLSEGEAEARALFVPASPCLEHSPDPAVPGVQKGLGGGWSSPCASVVTG